MEGNKIPNVMHVTEFMLRKRSLMRVQALNLGSEKWVDAKTVLGWFGALVLKKTTSGKVWVPTALGPLCISNPIATPLELPIRDFYGLMPFTSPSQHRQNNEKINTILCIIIINCPNVPCFWHGSWPSADGRPWESQWTSCSSCSSWMPPVVEAWSRYLYRHKSDVKQHY